MKLPRAKEPFHFFTRLSLTEATGLKARDLPELLEGIRTVPDTVIYTHTHRFVQQHQFLAPEPTNDFAVWAAEVLQDKEAGEKLMAVDTVQYNTTSELRQALIAVVEDHLKKRPSSRTTLAGEEFHFLRSIRFSLPTRHKAWDLAEFCAALRKVTISSLYLHIFEAKLRPSQGVNDFSVWFERELGEKELATTVARLDPYAQTHEALRASLLQLVEERLERLGRG
jgi:hypothetical protein